MEAIAKDPTYTTLNPERRDMILSNIRNIAVAQAQAVAEAKKVTEIRSNNH